MPQLNFPIDSALQADLVTYQGAVLQQAAKTATPANVAYRALLPALLRHALATLTPAAALKLLKANPRP